MGGLANADPGANQSHFIMALLRDDMSHQTFNLFLYFTVTGLGI